jgi:hypothetical protein
MVDLGRVMNITGTQVMWEKSGAAYKYTIETSTISRFLVRLMDRPFMSTITMEERP